MRPIDPTVLAPVDIPDNTGPAPDLRWLPIKDLIVDPRYQRDIARSGVGHIRRIAQSFDWRLFSCVIVSPVPGGLFAIIDGQHRVTAAALIGIDTVPCQIIQADAQQQAQAFAAINGNTVKIRAEERYKAALAGGDADALRVRRLCEAANILLLTSNPSSKARKQGETTAHSAIRELTSSLGDQDAIFALRCLRAAAGTDAHALKTGVIRAALQIFEDHREWRGRADVLAAFDFIDLIETAEASRSLARQRRGLNVCDLMAAAMIDVIEAQLKAGGGDVVAIPKPSHMRACRDHRATDRAGHAGRLSQRDQRLGRVGACHLQGVEQRPRDQRRRSQQQHAAGYQEILHRVLHQRAIIRPYLTIAAMFVSHKRKNGRDAAGAQKIGVMTQPASLNNQIGSVTVALAKTSRTLLDYQLNQLFLSFLSYADEPICDRCSNDRAHASPMFRPGRKQEIVPEFCSLCAIGRLARQKSLQIISLFARRRVAETEVSVSIGFIANYRNIEAGRFDTDVHKLQRLPVRIFNCQTSIKFIARFGVRQIHDRFKIAVCSIRRLSTPSKCQNRCYSRNHCRSGADNSNPKILIHYDDALAFGCRRSERTQLLQVKARCFA